jgi:Fic family protein
VNFLTKDYFEPYRASLPGDIDAALASLTPRTSEDFEYLLEASAVYSSNIEGNTMDLNSFMNTKSAAGPKPKEFEEIVDLKAAYDFARTHELTEKNMLEAHAMLAKRIVSAGNQGTYRTDKVGVFSSQGLVYMAVEHEKVAGEMQKLFADMAVLSVDSAAEALYYASLAHLRFAEIHPFMDGNGRMARLLEKWLLSRLVGEKAWLIESERYYKEHLADYYKNINLGVNYYELDYSRSVPFLLMLPGALAATDTS